MSATDDSLKPDTPTKKGKGRGKEKNDMSRFAGSGTNFRAKLIGIEAVGEARGDRMCQDTMARLKAAARSAGEHKQRVLINVSLDGLRILDDKSGKSIHHHAVHRISFIARDTSDSRAFGYIYSPGDGRHKFFGIKTEKAAEALVLSLRDLFQVVFEMKKREVEEAKKLKDENKENFSKEETASDCASLNSQDSRLQETPQHLTVKAKFADALSANGEAVADLLHLESQLLNIEQGLQQFSSLGSGGPEGWSGGVPASPGGWSAGSDSWGTPSTPRSLGPGQADGSSGSQADQPVIVTASGGFHTTSTHSSGGFSTLPHPPPSSKSTTNSIPLLPKPGTSPMSASLPRPSSMRSSSHSGTPPKAAASQGKVTHSATPPLKSSGWATFDSPSPQEPTSGKLGIVPETAPSTEQPAPATTEPEVESKSFGGISEIEDPFKNDPFFSSTPAVESSAPTDKDNKYAVFSDLSQPSFTAAEEASVVQSNATKTNPFSESSVFSSSAITEAVSPPHQGHSTMNAAFASTPIQHTTSTSNQPVALDSDVPSIKQVAAHGSESSRNSSFKSQDGAPVERKADSPVSVQKPTLLNLSKKAPSQKPEIHSSLGISGTVDPFGHVSPATEAKLNTSAGITDDPFDTSAVLLPLKKGPYDFSQLKPVSLDTAHPFHNDHEDSPEKFVPAPTAPPPPLPAQVLTDLPPPTPPPRPGLAQRTSLQKQATFDSLSDPVPPPIPKRPTVSGQTSSPKLLRQATIQFPLESSAPPPPPPRPVVDQQPPPTARPVVDQQPPPTARPVVDQQPPPPVRPAVNQQPPPPTRPVVNQQPPPPTRSVYDTLPSTVSAAPARSTPPADPFAMTLPKAARKPSPHSRARPRPRAKTPANTSSGFSLPGGLTESDITERPSSVSEMQPDLRQSSFGKGNVESFATFPDPSSHQRNDSPALKKQDSVADPFTDVDPFAQDTTSADPFNDMPDPFESPEDPFSDHFKGELFTTKAVTVSTSEPPNEPASLTSDPDPFKDDPFAKDPFAKDPFAKDPFDMSSFSSLSQTRSADTTLRTDTSLDASVSLPVFSTDTSAVLPDDSSTSNSQDTNSTADGKKSDPFTFDVFSNDFFKTQLNGSVGNNNSSSSSWAFNCTTNDLITNKTTNSSAWAGPTKPDPTATAGSGSTEHSSPSLHPATSHRDNDSSSNSEIAEAFGDDSFFHQGVPSALNTENQNQTQSTVVQQ